jgi:hypothetical protein
MNREDLLKSIINIDKCPNCNLKLLNGIKNTNRWCENYDFYVLSSESLEIERNFLYKNTKYTFIIYSIPEYSNLNLIFRRENATFYNEKIIPLVEKNYFNILVYSKNSDFIQFVEKFSLLI